MKRPITTRAHAVLDFATVGLMLAMPRMLNCSASFKQMVTLLAIGKLSYALLTRHELGLIRALPMQTHLTLDVIAGGGLCVLPFITGERDTETVLACIGQGLFDIAAAPMTQTVASFDRPRHILESDRAIADSAFAGAR